MPINAIDTIIELNSVIFPTINYNNKEIIPIPSCRTINLLKKLELKSTGFKHR